MPFPSFGRSKRTDDHPEDDPRHHGELYDQQESVGDAELDTYLAALTPETAPESTDTGRRFGEAQVLQLRLNLIASDELKQLAINRGTSPQALAQEWVLERLSWEAQAASDQRRHGNP